MPAGFATDILSEAGDADLMIDRKSISPDVLSGGARMGKAPAFLKENSAIRLVYQRSLISSRSCSAFCLCLASSENCTGSPAMEVRKLRAEGQFSTAT